MTILLVGDLDFGTKGRVGGSRNASGKAFPMLDMKRRVNYPHREVVSLGLAVLLSLIVRADELIE
jgi:hypothetical protein